MQPYRSSVPDTSVLLEKFCPQYTHPQMLSNIHHSAPKVVSIQKFCPLNTPPGVLSFQNPGSRCPPPPLHSPPKSLFFKSSVYCTHIQVLSLYTPSRSILQYTIPEVLSAKNLCHIIYPSRSTVPPEPRLQKVCSFYTHLQKVSSSGSSVHSTPTPHPQKLCIIKCIYNSSVPPDVMFRLKFWSLSNLKSSVLTEVLFLQKCCTLYSLSHKIVHQYDFTQAGCFPDAAAVFLS